MDPLSISASVAGLVTLADMVFRTATKYRKEVKEARKEVDDLLSEIKKTSLLLHNLSLIAFDLESSATTGATAPSLQLDHLHDCQAVMRKIENGLKDAKGKFEKPSGFDRLQVRLKWPFSSTEMKDMMQSLRNHQSSINVALAADSLVQLRTCLSRQQDISDRVQGLECKAQKILDIQTEISIDKRKREVLDFFMRANPQSEFETSKRLRHPLTGLWLTNGEDFREWYETPNARLWLSGIPGAGKSVIAGAIITECLALNQKHPGRAIGYFFCTYRDQASHEAVAILSSLTAQLARQEERAYQCLQQYFNELLKGEALPRQPTADTLAAVLIEMCAFFNQVYLVIDGLDECGDHVEESVKSLRSLAIDQDRQQNINMALLSRDEIVIRERLETHFECLEIAAHTEDIQQYVATELEGRISCRKLRLRDLSLKDEILTELVHGAKGMFRWVACQLDHLCDLPTDKARRRALKALPPTLNETYERILLRVETYSKETRTIVRNSLQLIAVPGINSRMLCEAVCVSLESNTLDEDEIIDEEEILRWCGSLVRKSNDGTHIEFSHFTVEEYLRDRCPDHLELAVYGVTEETINSYLGPLCLRFLTLENFARRKPEATEAEFQLAIERAEVRPFYEHAAIYWPTYIRSMTSNGVGNITSLLHELFRPEKTPNICLWALELVRQSFMVAYGHEGRIYVPYDFKSGGSLSGMLECTLALFRPDFTPLHMAAALRFPDLCSHLLSLDENVNTRSMFGTPLHCGVGRGLSLYGGFHSITPRTERRYVEEDTVDTKWRSVVRVLLDAGAEINVTPPRSHGLLTLGLKELRNPYKWRDFEILNDLLEAGAAVEVEASYGFQHFFDMEALNFEGRQSELDDLSREPLKRFLGFLKSPESEGGPRKELYSIAFDFVHNPKNRGSNLGLSKSLEDDTDDNELLRDLRDVIQANNVPELERILQGEASTLAATAVFPRDGSTPLHVAIHSGSFNAFQRLLEAGYDPMGLDREGRAPIHLCWDADESHADYLRSLLRHGASTLLLDGNKESLWHRIAIQNSTGIASTLVGLDETSQALRLTSGDEETPICAGIRAKSLQSVLVFLPYCDSKAHWKSNTSMFRQAAILGSSTVIEKMLEVGVDLDGMDDDTGCPMHFLNHDASIGCINILINLFDSKQRPRCSGRTPFEEFILRAVNDRVPFLDPSKWKTLLPATDEVAPEEAARIWSSMSNVLDVVLSFQWGNKPKWLIGVYSHLIERGLLELCHKDRQKHILISACAIIIANGESLDVYNPWRHLNKRKLSTDLPDAGKWTWASKLLQKLLSSTTLGNIVGEREILELMQHSILHNDSALLTLLLKSGADVHARVKSLSAFEYSCFLGNDLSSENFELILQRTKAAELVAANDEYEGCGPIHFTSGPEGQSRLLQLLRTGLNCNLPVSEEYGTPLTCHLRVGSVDTAQVLLEHGADPWIPSPLTGYNAVLGAIGGWCASNSLLDLIALLSEENGYPPKWDQRFNIRGEDFNRQMSGGNALHLTAFTGQFDALRFILLKGHLHDLNAVDDISETPMHYAARCNHVDALQFLADNGGDISFESRNGSTPLHVAAGHGNLAAVKTLLKLGAVQTVDSFGCSPLVCAYIANDADTARLLETREISTQCNDTITHPKGVSTMAKLLLDAIEADNLGMCKTLRANGCPLNIELTRWRHSPLAVAILAEKSLELVEWLLTHSENVSAVFQDDNDLTVVHAAVRCHKYNKLLPTLLSKYFEEADSLPVRPILIVQNAINVGNVEVLETLLDFLRQKDAKNSQVTDRNTANSTGEPRTANNQLSMLNQQDPILGCTPLHLAISLNRLDVVELFLANHADVEARDTDGWTPLHVAAHCGDIDIVRTLLDAGCSINVVDSLTETPVTLSAGNPAMTALLIDRGASLSVRALDGSSPLFAIITIRPVLPRIVLRGIIATHDIDIHASNVYGISLAHLIVSTHRSYLGMLIEGEIPSSWVSNLRWRDIEAWEPNYLLARVDSVASNAKVLRRHLTSQELEALCGLNVPGQHNFQCQAACSGMLQAVKDFLHAGANIEYQCDSHGTPLMAAISTAQFEIVRYLIRAGASLPCRGKQAFKACPWDPAITHWLIVTRHTEQGKLTSGHVSQETEEIFAWSGVRLASVSLKWEWRKSRYESILEYAKRRQAIISGLSGEIVTLVSQ